MADQAYQMFAGRLRSERTGLKRCFRLTSKTVGIWKKSAMAASGVAAKMANDNRGGSSGGLLLDRANLPFLRPARSQTLVGGFICGDARPGFLILSRGGESGGLSLDDAA
jgi:hypothetical protein